MITNHLILKMESLQILVRDLALLEKYYNLKNIKINIGLYNIEFSISNNNYVLYHKCCISQFCSFSDIKYGIILHMSNFSINYIDLYNLQQKVFKYFIIRAARKVPNNYIALGVFTFAESWMVSTFVGLANL